MNRGLANITREELENYIAWRYDLPGAKALSINYANTTDTIQVVVEHESLQRDFEGVELPWLPVLNKQAKGASHRIPLIKECLEKLEGCGMDYKGRLSDNEFYFLVRNIAKYLLEQAGEEQAKTLTLEQLQEKYSSRNCLYK